MEITATHYEAENIDPSFLKYEIRKKLLKLKEPQVIAVVAQVTDIDEWNKLPDVTTNVVIQDNEEFLVTARIADSRFREISKSPFVRSLKIASFLFPT